MDAVIDNKTGSGRYTLIEVPNANQVESYLLFLNDNVPVQPVIFLPDPFRYG